MATPAASVEQELRQSLVKFQQSAVVISDQTSYDAAVARLTEIKTWRKRWAEYWTPLKDAAHKSWKGLCDKFNEGDSPAATAENTVKRAILDWDMEQERLRQEAQRKAEEEARKKEEEERAAQAAQMEFEGVSEDDIDAVLSAPPVAVAPVVQPTYQKASGISKRDNWVTKVTDLKSLCKAIGAGKFKLNPTETQKAVEFFESLLKSHAVANQTTMNIPGCKAENQPILGARVR